jgi:hypothetical protein
VHKDTVCDERKLGVVYYNYSMFCLV